MKQLRAAIAGILALVAATAATAQQFPTVPAQTVIGRLGVPGDTGPSQAIPFTTFTSRLLSAGVLSGLALPTVNASSDMAFYDTSPMAAGQGGRIAFGGKINNTPGTLFEWAAIGAPKANSTSGNTVGSLAFYLRSNAGDKWGAPKMTLSEPGLLTLIGTGVKQLGLPDANREMIIDGSAAAPITASAPTQLISRYENVTGGGDGSQGAALVVASVGAGTTQNVGITGIGYSLGNADTVALYGSGIKASGTGAAFGLFALATHNSAASSGLGANIGVSNSTGLNLPYASNLLGAQISVGIDLSYGANAVKRGTVGILVRGDYGTGAGAAFDVGIGFNRFGGISPTVSADIQTDSDAVAILLANSGAHTNGIDLTGSGSTYSGSAFKSPGFAIAGTGAASFGKVGGTTGTINMLGSTSGTVSILAAAAAGTYSLNLPTTAGSAGQVLTSQGGGSNAMTWTTPAACATCVTSAASLTANSLMIGAGSQASAVTTTGTGVLTALGVNTGSAGAFVVHGGALGTPSSGTLTSATGLPISTGLTGAGTGVLTALGVNVGTAGSVLVNGGALGTPSSGTVTNLTGTASININGTVGATTPATGSFTTVSVIGTGGITSSRADGGYQYVIANTGANPKTFGFAVSTADGSWQFNDQGAGTFRMGIGITGGVKIGTGSTSYHGDGTIDAAGAYYANGTKGCTGTLSTLTSITITNGIITAMTGTGGPCA